MPRGEPPAIRIEPATASDAPALARLRRHVHGLHVRQAMARSLGIDELLTDIWAFNEEAQAFAQACGFRPQMVRFRMRGF